MKKWIKNTSNLTLHNSRTFTASSVQTSTSVDPWFIAGFADGESSFSFSIIKSDNYKVGWYIRPVFQIELGGRDIALLESIRSYMGVGNIAITQRGTVKYSVRNLNDLTSVIIPFFDTYNLITKKQADFQIFKEIINLMNNKEHLSEEGLKKILSLRASLNWGLSPGLLESFPSITPVSRPEVKAQEIPDPNWLAGFTSAEGCFRCRIYKSTSKIGESVELELSVTQHSRDIALIKSLDAYLGCGTTLELATNSAVRFYVKKFSYIYNIIIPFYKKYPIQGTKSLDFNDFCKVAELVNNKAHLTTVGLDKIRQIKDGMNSKRNAHS